MGPFKSATFLPEDLKQLLRFVPGRGWEALEWRPLLDMLRSLAWQYASNSGVSRLAAAVSESVPKIGIGSKPRDAVGLDELTHGAQRRAAGDRILHLYFRQWLVQDGLFLDLRPARFRVLSPELYFQPNGLWIRFRAPFREGVVALYRAFYSGDEAGVRAALLDLGMLRPGLAAGTEDELLGLLKAHFGLEQGAQRFSIERFKDSFDRLFDFFIANDYRLHSDFVFLGFYLITLYLSLESLGQAHDVRKICLGALPDDY